MKSLKIVICDYVDKLKIYSNIAKNRLAYKIYGRRIHILSIPETIDEIVNNHVSISRFGDGELVFINGVSLGFQTNDSELSKRLEEVLLSNQSNHLVCVVDLFTKERMSYLNEENQKWWNRYFDTKALEWFKYLKTNKVYGNAFISRFYIQFENKELSYEYIKLLKKIWDNKKIVIVEGEKTRMGCENDLLSDASEVKRILCPAENAFSVYDKILSECKRLPDDYLFLIALGPTATVLAYDLCREGYQAIDIGHIDLEYEWMKMGVKRKVDLPNKYVNEVKGGRIVAELDDLKYSEEIIARIEA